MNKYFKYSILIILLLVSIRISSQEPIGNEEPEVKVIGTVTKEAIKLRWAVNTPLAWKYAIQYGYIVERKTIAIDGELLKIPVTKKLTVTPILPKPLPEWENFVDKSDQAAVAAQAMYGDDFNIEFEEGGNGFLNIVNQAKVLEQRFSFALFAADQDYEIAEFSGLAFIDSDVKPNEQYLYQVYSAIPKERMKVKPGGVYLGLKDYKPLPEPLEFIGIFKDKSVLLSWNYKLLQREYNSYIIERADANNNFKPLNDIPLVNFNGKEKKSSDRMFFIDSLSQNDKEYKYRIKGISPFGEIGPPSKVIAGQGKAPLVYNPAITEAKLKPNNNSTVITWEFPQKGLETLAYFELNRSDEVNGNYTTIQSNISKSVRSITVNELKAINYFTITAVGVDGTKRVSFPQMVQPVDDIPPSTPLDISGVIDSTGIVQLRWKMNTEKDFLGYRVFKANFDNEEFTQITFRPIPQNEIIDTVNVKTLNNKVYYKIQAFDKRYNPSGFSKILMLKKPDVIPPTKPVFKSFKADNGIITLHWIPSSSIDASKTLVYRKERGNDTPWELIVEKSLPENTYDDMTANLAITYLYTLVTVDESGLESAPVTPLVIRLPDNTPKHEIDKFSELVNREEKKIFLNWKYDAGNVVEYLLYRAEEEKQPTLYKVFKGKEYTFIDQNLRVNTRYTYMLQAVFETGAKSPLKKIEVEY